MRGVPGRLATAVCLGVLAFGIYGLPGAAGATAKPTVSLGTVKGIGKVLVDANQHTLYTLVNNHQAVACTGACLDMGFVPLTIKPGSKPSAGKGVSGLGVVNGNQVTVNDFPLFVFSADKVHEANGQGMTSSGGTWHTPKVTGSSSGSKKKGGGTNPGTGGVSF
jgi:predicted lipoprotein with Yx(FWY)xxD motif